MIQVVFSPYGLPAWDFHVVTSHPRAPYIASAAHHEFVPLGVFFIG